MSPPLVLLHSAITDSRMWEPSLPALSAARRVVADDRRGFGETPLEAAPARGRTT